MLSFKMSSSVEEKEEKIEKESETDEEDWDSEYYDSSSEDEITPPEGGFEWTTRNELALLYSLTCKPVGICRHFVMAYIHHKFTKALKVRLSAQAIWDHMDTLWDMKYLEQMYRRDMKEALEKVIDFELPFDEYGDLMARKVGVGKCFLTRRVIHQARQILLEQYRARAMVSRHKVKPSYVKLERIPDDILARYTNSNCLSPVAKRKKVSESSPSTDFMELNEMAGTSSKTNEDCHRLPARHFRIAEKCESSSSSHLKKFIEKYGGNECSYLPCVVIEKDLCSLIEGTEICLSSHDAKILNSDKNQHCSEIMLCNEKSVSEKTSQSKISQIQKSQASYSPNVLLEKNLYPEIKKAKVQVSSDLKAILKIQNIANGIETGMGNKTMNNDDSNDLHCSEEGNMKIAENDFITKDNIFDDKCEDEICYQEESLNKEPLNAAVNFHDVKDLSDVKAILKVQNTANGIETDMENKAMHNNDANSPLCSEEGSMMIAQNDLITKGNIFYDKCEDGIFYQEESLDKELFNAEVNGDEVQDLSAIPA